ncbi:MAG: HINT domain-containing protein [Myxococcales bacterium]|nr:HINT domain-containing protein [Myxococcales bacterium]
MQRWEPFESDNGWIVTETELWAADDVVQVCGARTGGGSEAVVAELEVGHTWLDDGRLHRWTDDGVADRGEATVADLAEAGATRRAAAAARVSGAEQWVLVLGEADEAGHWRLGAVEAGERLAFQGWVFETADTDDDGLIEIQPTGDVLGRVCQTHVRRSDVVINLVVTGPDGSETLTGTPEHPFWVPEVGGYVAMGDLEVGIVLRTVGSGEARVVSMDWREGDFEVFNFEVEDAHNYYVRAPGGSGDGVLVHNGCGPKLNVGSGDNAMPGAINMDVRPGPGVDVVGDVNAMPFGNQTFSEVHAVNPFGFNPVSAETARVLEPGGTLKVTGTARNRFAQATDEAAAAAGLRKVGSGPMDPDHAFGVQKTTSGGVLRTGSSTTTTYMKDP